MCYEHRTVYTICAHATDTRKCELSRKVRTCDGRKFADVELCLGWCPACHKHIARAHRRGGDSERKLDPRDPAVIRNYWALKSWYSKDRVMAIEEVPMDLLGADDPVTYRVTTAVPKHPADEEAGFRQPVDTMPGAEDEVVVAVSRIEPMPLEPDGTFNFEKAAVCFQCRQFGPNQVYCDIVSKGFRSTYSFQVHRLVQGAHEQTLGTYAKKAVVRRPSTPSTAKGQTWKGSVMELTKEVDEFLARRPTVHPLLGPQREQAPLSGPERHFQLNKFMAMHNRPRKYGSARELVWNAQTRKMSWRPSLRHGKLADKKSEGNIACWSFPAEEHRASGRQRIEEMMEQMHLLCFQHGRDWVSGCEECQKSQVLYWTINTTVLGPGPPETPCPPPKGEEPLIELPEGWEYMSH